MKVPFAVRATPSGFTMIELIVVLAVLMILTGLILPGLGQTFDRARLTRMMSVVQGDAQALQMYAADSDGAFPRAHEHAKWSMLRWYEPIVSGGYFESARDADPIGIEEYGIVRVLMSMCLAAEPRYFTPGHTMFGTPSSVVRQPQVLFPSSKGMLVHQFAYDWYHEKVRDSDAWCCTDLEVRAVAMCDGAVVAGTWRDFLLEPPLYIENEIGYPVLSTWGGYLGRDRP